MNNNSEDVVKNVESNKVESTSNEQRQTNKPIVISRRRLLRAGVAGIPVVLTMTGLAPAADDIKTLASAASGLMYGGNKVYNRFYNERHSDGLVWTDHNGFVLQSAGGVITSPLTVSTDSSTNGQKTVTVTGTYVGGGDTPSGDPPEKSFTLSITPPNNLTVNAYQHKTGVWYTDRIVRTGTPKDLLEFIEGLELTVKDESSNSVTAEVTNKAAAFTSSGTWYQTVAQGWSIENPGDDQDYYLLPASGPAVIDVNFSANVSFTVSDTVNGYDYTYNATVTIPLKLNVSDIPAPTADDHGI